MNSNDFWGFGFSLMESVDYAVAARPHNREEFLLISHLKATGNLPLEWITSEVHPKAEC